MICPDMSDQSKRMRLLEAGRELAQEIPRDLTEGEALTVLAVALCAAADAAGELAAVEPLVRDTLRRFTGSTYSTGPEAPEPAVLPAVTRPRRCLVPDKGHGAGDQFPGSDFDGL